jgi:short-subunit dehydrogenase
MEIAGKRALITGASGGIGKAIACALHRKGAEVVVSARREEVLNELCAELGDRAHALPADLANRADLARLHSQAGDIDILVANAGLPGSGSLDDFTPEEIDHAIDVNLRAPVQLARAFFPAMVERGHGHLAFIGSLNSKIPNPGSSVYSAGKFGLRGFALALREDLQGSGVGVTVVYPGFIRDAGMWAETGIELPKGVGTKTPDEVADAVVKGIEKNRAEIDVAPVAARAGSKVAMIAPAVFNAATRRAGSHDLAAKTGDAQKNKR